jgi:hypothetical protein
VNGAAHFFRWPNNKVEETPRPVSIASMTSLENTPTNQTKLAQADNAWRQVVRQTLQRGFHGTAVVELAVQDGTIQHVRRRIEQLDK